MNYRSRPFDQLPEFQQDKKETEGSGGEKQGKKRQVVHCLSACRGFIDAGSFCLRIV